MKKLNILLAITDHLAASSKTLIAEYVSFFKHNQGDFKGEKKTYEPKPGTIDAPGQRSNKLVVTTVGEKLEYLEQNSADYIDALFAQEKTNSMNIAKARLVVDEIDMGEYSSLELLRMKSLLENANFKTLYETLPVREDKENWSLSRNEDYTGREIYETAMIEGVAKSTMKESYILPDPNIGKAGDNYTPQVASRDTIIELGEYTLQRFSGEISHRERAFILQRRTKLITAVIAALKVANDVEAIPSEMTASKLFNYLHRGK